jgi:high affinity choline transporter 7
MATLNPRSDATYALPLLLRYMVPAAISLFGLAAIIGAVTSSFSSSILSAGSMASWNVYRPLLRPDATVAQMKLVIRGSIVVFGALAAVLALRSPSVKDLWFFCADLVFVLLVPQLVFALFDPKANRIGSIVAFAVSLTLRLGAGEPILGIPAFIPYPEIFADWLPGGAAAWYDGPDKMLFPFRVLAAATGMVLLPVVSRLTGAWDSPRSLELPNDSATSSASAE